MPSAKYYFYRIIRFLVPKKYISRFTGAAITQPIRDRFFRPGNQKAVTGGFVQWQDLRFYFQAPYQTYYHAESKGIENGICKIARSVLREGDTAIDIGANYGFISLVAASSVGQAGHVFSFEIDPVVARTLAETIEKNHLTDVVRVIPKGAGSKTEDGFVSVDEFLSNQSTSSIRFIKIDVDGNDYDVLLGIQKIMREQHPVIVIEMSTYQQEIYDLLRGLGYTNFMDQSRNLFVEGEWPLNLVASCQPIQVD